MKLQKPHTNFLPQSSFFLIKVLNDWNSLPQSVIDANSVNNFKNLLDSYYVIAIVKFLKKAMPVHPNHTQNRVITFTNHTFDYND